MASINSRQSEDQSNAPELCHGADAAVKQNSPRAFPISEFCRRYGICRTKAYDEIAAGRLRAVKAGRRTLIPQDAAESWLAALPQVRRL
jgi:excisionase family DNA binding protein